MKFKKVIPIAFLAFIYIITIKDTITLSFIPGPEFSIFVSNIPPSILSGIVAIEIFFSLGLFLAPIAFLKDTYKESPPTKPDFPVSLFISGIFPILVIINNYVSGIFLYSAVLLICGIILTLEIIRLNIVGVKRDPIPKEKIEDEQVIEGLCTLIEEYEYLRPPIITGISPYPLKIQFTLLSKQKKKLSFKHSYPELYNKIKKELNPIFKNAIYVRPYNPPVNEFLLRYSLRYETNLYRRRLQNKDKPNLIVDEMDSSSGFSIIIGIILSFFITAMIFKFISLSDDLSINISPILLFIIIFSSIYFVYVYMSTRNRQIWGEKCNDATKNAIQELINKGIELIKKESLNPQNYPLKLRHNDYKGLKYKINGNYNYTGFFEK